MYFRDIDWLDPLNIIILLRNEDKTDNKMLELLGFQIGKVVL